MNNTIGEQLDQMSKADISRMMNFLLAIHLVEHHKMGEDEAMQYVAGGVTNFLAMEDEQHTAEKARNN